MGSIRHTGHDYDDEEREIDADDDIATDLDDFIDAGDEVDQAYQEFADSSGITDRQGEMISDRRDVIEDLLSESLDIKESHLMGSFTRETMVGPLNEDSDADILLVLDESSHPEWTRQKNGATNALRAVKRRIQNDPRFSQTNVSIDKNVVQVGYHDSTLEIAPGFDYTAVANAEHPRSGFNLFNSANDGYAIPDTHGEDSWMGTNPRAYKNQFEARDKANNGKVSGVTRMAKKWAANQDVPVRSYHMEMMVYNHFADKATRGGTTPSTYNDAAAEFMQELPNRIRSTTREPVYNEAVDSGMSPEDRREAAEKAEQAADTLRRATEAKETGDTETARDLLRDEYGEGF